MKSILTYARTEEGKALRRLIGDNGGIKFQNKMLVIPSGERSQLCNALTSVQKDNLIIEIWKIV